MAGGGNGLPRAAGARGRAAPSRAQGHLTRWEPRPEARGDTRGTGARAEQGPTAPRGSGRGRLRAAAALGAHRLRCSARLTGLPCPPRPCEVPQHRLQPVPGRGRSSLSAVRNGFLSELCLASTSQCQTPQPPPAIALQANMAAAAA